MLTSSILIEIGDDHLVNHTFIVPDEVVARHTGRAPCLLKAGISMKPRISRLMIDLVASRVLRSARCVVMVLGHGKSPCILFMVATFAGLRRKPITGVED